MRIDKFLKISGIIKRRTLANEACDNGRVLVNGKPIKASYEVKIGDVIRIRFGEKTFSAKVEKVLEHVKKEDMSTLYTVIE